MLPSNLQFYIFLCCGITAAYGQCKIEIPSNREKSPIYELALGTRAVRIPYTEDVYLEEGERITGFCPTIFKYLENRYLLMVIMNNRLSPPLSYLSTMGDRLNDFHYVLDEPTFDAYGVFNQRQPEVNVLVTGEHNVSMHCHNQTLFYLGTSDHSMERPLLERELSCGELKWGIYEVSKPFSWCQPPLGSYALAARFFLQEVILGIFCYDIDQMELRTLHYTLEAKLQHKDHNNFQFFISRPSTFHDIELGEEISNFNTFFKIYSFKMKTAKGDESRFYSELDVNSHDNHWLHIADYTYKPIVQAGPYADLFQKYEDVLDILWWPTLRLANWHNLFQVLIERANNATYNVFTGTTGGLHLPLPSKYSFRSANKTIPAYIWIYLQERSGSEQLLVFAYNSPYYDFFAVNDIIFCEDICHQIPWLKSARSTFRMSALGIIFCCAVDSSFIKNFQAGLPFDKILKPDTSGPTTVAVATSSPAASMGSTPDMWMDIPLPPKPDDVKTDFF